MMKHRQTNKNGMNNNHFNMHTPRGEDGFWIGLAGGGFDLCRVGVAGSWNRMRQCMTKAFLDASFAPPPPPLPLFAPFQHPSPPLLPLFVPFQHPSPPPCIFWRGQTKSAILC